MVDPTTARMLPTVYALEGIEAAGRFFVPGVSIGKMLKMQAFSLQHWGNGALAQLEQAASQPAMHCRRLVAWPSRAVMAPRQSWQWQ